MSHHIWWIPCIIIYYAIYTWLGKMCNENTELVWHQNKWLWYTYLFGICCPFWAIVSVISKNLMWDGMLYDSILIITFVITMICLGGGDRFQWQQWLGVVLAATGMVLMKINFKQG